MQVKSRATNFEDGRTSKSTHPFRAIHCERSSLFLLLSFIKLRENRQHFVRQILWNFIARPQLLPIIARTARRATARPWHVIQFIA